MNETKTIKKWPCQDLLGGKAEFLNVDEYGFCNHPECNPVSEKGYDKGCKKCHGSGIVPGPLYDPPEQCDCNQM